MTKMPVSSAAPSLNLNVAGAVSRSQLQNLSVIYGQQSVIPIPLYDTLSVPNGNAAVTFSFFQQSHGAPGLGYAFTNMEAPGQLISGKVFIATEITLDVTQIAPAITYTADLMAFTHGAGSYTLYINNVQFAQGLIKDLIGGGLFGFGNNPAIGSTTSLEAQVPYACPRVGSGRGAVLSPALVIPTQTQFSLVFNYPAGSPPNPALTTLLRPTLRGQLIRLMSA